MADEKISEMGTLTELSDTERGTHFIPIITPTVNKKISPEALFGTLWRDITAEITVEGAGGGAADPAFVVYKGNIRGYQFAVNDEVFFQFHMPHDYIEGTDLYIHAHWSHIDAAVVSGACEWEFEASYAKGHNQEPFSTNVTAAASENASTTQYQHMVTEVQLSAAGGAGSLLDTDDLEPDGLVLVRTILKTNTMSAANDPFLHQVDLHYQSNSIGTKNKAPDFDT